MHQINYFIISKKVKKVKGEFLGEKEKLPPFGIRRMGGENLC